MSGHSRFHDVWLIPTSHGQAIRNKDDLVVEDGMDGVMRRLGAPTSHSSIIPQLVPSANLLTVPFLPSDLPDPSRSETEVCNVCGFVFGFSVAASHPAWRTVRSTLGCFKEAYTLRGGNLIYLRGKLVFKGAVSYQVWCDSHPCDGILSSEVGLFHRVFCPPSLACFRSPVSQRCARTSLSPPPICAATSSCTTAVCLRKCSRVSRGAVLCRDTRRCPML